MKIGKHIDLLFHSRLMLCLALLFSASGLYAQEPKLMLPVGNNTGIVEIGFSPAGTFVYTGAENTKIWAANSGLLLLTDSAKNLTFSNNERYFVLHDRYGGLNIFEASGNKLLFTVKGVLIGFSNDNTAIIYRDYNNLIYSRSITSGKLIYAIKDAGPKLEITFSPDGRYLAFIGKDNMAHVLSAKSGKLLFKHRYAKIKGDLDYSTNIRFNLSGSYMSIPYKDSVFIVNTAGRKPVFTISVCKNCYLGQQSAIFGPASTHSVVQQMDQKKIAIRDLRSGAVKCTINDTLDILNPVLNKNDDYLITGPYNFEFKLWNARSGKLIKKLNGGGSNICLFDNSGTRVIRGDYNGLSCYNAATGKLLWKFKTVSEPEQCIRDWQGKYLAIALHDHSAIVVNMEGRLIATMKREIQPLNKIVVSEDGKLIFAETVINAKDLTTADSSIATVWERSTGKILLNHKIRNGGQTLFKAPYLVESAEDPFYSKVYNVNTGKLLFKTDSLLTRFFKSTEMPHINGSLQLNPAQNMFLTTSYVNYRPAVELWDLSNGNHLQTINVAADKQITQAYFSPLGKYLWLTYLGDLATYVFDANTGLQVYEQKWYMGKGNETFAFGADDQSLLLNQTHDSTAALIALQTNKRLNTIPFNERSLISTKSRSYIFNNQVYDLFTNYKKGTLPATYKWTIDKSMMIGNMVEKRTMISDVDYIFSTNGDYLFGKMHDSVAVWKNGQEITYLGTVKGYMKPVIGDHPGFSYKNGALLFCENLVYDLPSLRQGKLDDNLDPVSDNISISEADSSFTLKHDYKLDTYSLNDLKLKYSSILIDSASIFRLLPNGYYWGDINTSKKLHYVKGLQAISFDQLDVKYNRPDKVLHAIGSTDTALIQSYKKAYDKRIKKLGIDTTRFKSGYSVPKADFKNRSLIGYTQKDRLLKLHFVGSDDRFLLDRFNIWVNDVPVYGMRGISLKKRQKKALDTTITIMLSQGDNRIEASVTNNNGTESYRVPLIVKYTSAVVRPKLYFAGIGINRFRNKSNPLHYSVKDIRDLAAKLKQKYGKDLVIVDTLFDSRVSKKNIKALKTGLKKATVDDKVLIAYSGHGLLSSNFDYYLSTYDINFKKPQVNGLPYDALEDLLDGIPSRQKLMLIDACNSGEVDKDEKAKIDAVQENTGLTGLQVTRGIDLEGSPKLGMQNSFELMRELFVNVGKGTGATIIAAAGGAEFAQERGDLANGVFTWCILKAMDNNKTLKVSELKRTVGAQVEKMTKGLQKPTSRNETINYDWAVW